MVFPSQGAGWIGICDSIDQEATHTIYSKGYVPNAKQYVLIYKS